MNCCGTRVMVQHELFNKAHDDSFISNLITARVGDVLYVDSLPKSYGFKFRIRFKSGHFGVDIMSQISKSSL